MKNYKSIKNLEIDFHHDLNIVIGKNGSGKTNVLKLAYMSLRNAFDDVENDFETEIEIKDKDSLLQLHSAKKNEPIEFEDILRNGKSDDYSFRLKVLDNENNLKKQINDIDLIENELLKFRAVFIGHGLPKGHLYFFEEPFGFTFSNNRSREIVEVIFDSQSPFFIKTLVSYYHFVYLSKYDELVSKETIVKDVYDFFNQNYRDNLKHILDKFTEIEDVRLNNSLFINEIDKGVFSVKNIYFEFKIRNKWLPFSYLSDGLQRIVIILSEISLEKIRGNYEKYHERYITDKIILLEEPELGIHPHFLFKLMSFLKEASRNHQIILSTHSPEILDHLNKDELDRIIICTNKDDYGTRLKHLSKTEIKEAQDYMEDLDLSDYWKHADLER